MSGTGARARVTLGQTLGVLAEDMMAETKCDKFKLNTWRDRSMTRAILRRLGRKAPRGLPRGMDQWVRPSNALMRPASILRNLTVA